MLNRETTERDPILKHLSTEQLENLLSQDFDWSGEQEPDVDYIMAVMEVIRERDAEAGEAAVDVDAAWEDFQQNYQNRRPASEPPALRETESPHLNQSSQHKSPQKHFKATRYLVLAALVGVLLCGAAEAFGFHVFQALASWTTETFGFTAPAEPAEADPFAQLRSAVAHETTLPIVPHYAPEGTEETGDFSIDERRNGIRIADKYKIPDGEFSIHVIIYDINNKDYTGTYQKDAALLEVYEVNGLNYYLMSNRSMNVVTWTNENVEILIQGDLDITLLKQMVDSIYN